jgi:hypothetical protein
MANLEERIRQIVREEMGQDPETNNDINFRLATMQQQIDDLHKDFQELLPGESKPGGH